MKIFIYNHNTAGKHFLNTNIEFNVKIFTALWISIITFDGIQEPTLTIELLGDPLNEYDEKEREREMGKLCLRARVTAGRLSNHGNEERFICGDFAHNIHSQLNVS